MFSGVGRLGLRAVFGGVAWTPLLLFANGEQGAWYDPSDFSTMFQDSSGTTPVTAVEQPVGLILDKRKNSIGSNGSRRLNLFSYTQEFDNASWAKPNCTITANATTAPDGTLTADQFNRSGTSFAFVSQEFRALGAPSTQYKLIVSAKAGTQNFLVIQININSDSAASFLTFDLVNGVVGTKQDLVGSVTMSGSMTNSGSGWWECSLNLTAISTSVAYIGASNAQNTRNGNDLGTIFLWGADVRLSTNSSVAPFPYQFISANWASTISGNHATQTTSTKRPVLSGRVNLLSYTDDITPTYWPNSFVSGGTRSNASLSVTSNEGYVYFTSQDFTAQAITYIASFDAVCDQTIANVPLRVTFGAVGAYALVSFTANQKTRVNINITTAAGVTGLNIGIDARSAIVPGGSDATGYVVTVSNPDLRPVGVGVGLPSYQRVSTSTDYDTAGFPIYLKFDGVDDYLLSGSINAGTNKGQILSGIRKILELTEIVAETGGGGDIGSFHVANLSSASYQAYTVGSAAGGQTATSSVAAPSTNVVCNFSDISAPFVRLRVNGVQTAENTGTLGSGNFGNLPIYIGVRNVTTFPFSGNIYGLIVRFGANLDSDQTYNAENYLGQKSAVSIPAPSPSVFSPLSLFSSGAQGMWYDPSDFSTMFQDWQGTTPVTATGQPVGKILDKSGNNNHLYQGTAGSRPLLQQDGSGKYYLDFDGTNDYMFTGENSGGTLITRTVPFGTSNSQSVTVVSGARKTSDASVRLILSSSPFDLNTNSFYLRAPGSTGVSNYAMRASGDVDFADAAATGYTAPITNVITGIATPSTNTILLRVNGTQVASQTATTLGNGPFGDDVFYFGSLNTSQRFFIGRIYSTVVLGRLTTGTELSDTETWVNGKTGAY